MACSFYLSHTELSTTRNHAHPDKSQQLRTITSQTLVRIIISISLVNRRIIMDTFINQLLQSHRVDSSHLTIVNDNPSLPEFHSIRSSTLIKLSRYGNSKKNVSAPSRWSAFSENKKDTRKVVFSSNRGQMFQPSFPSAHLTGLCTRKSGSDNKNSKPKKVVDEIGGSNHSLTIKDVFGDYTYEKDRDKLLSSYGSFCKKGFSSSAEMTEATFDMDDSFESTLECGKSASNIHTSVLTGNKQPPKAPQRKISQEKLQTLKPFLSYSSSFGEVWDKSKQQNNNVSFDDAVSATTVYQNQSRTFTTSQIPSIIEVRFKGGKKKTKRNLYNQQKKEGRRGPNNHDGVQRNQVQRLRGALGSMAPRVPLRY